MWRDINLERVSLQTVGRRKKSISRNWHQSAFFKFNIWSVGCCSHHTERIQYAVYWCSFLHFGHFLQCRPLHTQKQESYRVPYIPEVCSNFNLLIYIFFLSTAFEFLLNFTSFHWNLWVHKEWVQPAWLFRVMQRHVAPSQSVSAYMLCTLGRSQCLFVPYRIITS